MKQKAAGSWGPLGSLFIQSTGLYDICDIAEDTAVDITTLVYIMPGIPGSIQCTIRFFVMTRYRPLKTQLN